MNVSLLINDKDVVAANGATFERLNPISGAVASTAAAAGALEATAAADAAAAAFPAWSALGPNERRARLNPISHLLSLVAYQPVEYAEVKLPHVKPDQGYERPPLEQINSIPEVY